MNAVEIEEAVSKLAEAPFDPAAFPYAFLEAFGNKETTLKRLKSGNTNQSDLPGGILQRNNVHIKVCPEGEMTATLGALRGSTATARHKAKFILATDGKSFEAENLVDGETVACSYADFHDHFGFFQPLAGITTVKQIRENAFDIKATGRLNRLYIELLRENPDWDTAARRPDLNHFFARLIFCFFAEDTNIFHSSGLFTATVEQMSARDSSNTHEVLSEVFTYTYYEQLNGYQYLKQLDIGYYFYAGSYTDTILKVLNPAEKTILHIPNVNARESTKDKIREVEHILEELGEWQGADPKTGFQLVKTADGTILKIADLVDDDPAKREKVSAALRDSSQKNNRDHVGIIIALGMAKAGFDWIWCEHALTVGYRSSLTEIVQIIGRATRDAPGKMRAKFTNLIAEPDASEAAVTEAVNDTLKAISASLLMEQVLAPRFEFRPKNPNNGPTPGMNYGVGGYDPGKCNIGGDPRTGLIQLEIKGLAEPKSPEADRICREDLTELITAFVQDTPALERGLFDRELAPEELTQIRMGKIVKEKFPNLDEEDQEAVRQHAIAALNVVQQAKKWLGEGGVVDPKNTSLIDGVRRFALSVQELDIDLIDRINPFGEAYAILAKSMSEERLRAVAEVIAAKRVSMTLEEARDLAKRGLRFKAEKGRLPALTATDPWEKRMAEGIAFLQRKAKEGGNA